MKLRGRSAIGTAKRVKMIVRLFLVAFTASIAARVTHGQIARGALPPQVIALTNSVRTIPAPTGLNTIIRSTKAGSPKAIAAASSTHIVQGGNRTLDLVHRKRPALSPKDPRNQATIRRFQQGQIPPLK